MGIGTDVRRTTSDVRIVRRTTSSFVRGQVYGLMDPRHSEPFRLEYGSRRFARFQSRSKKSDPGCSMDRSSTNQRCSNSDVCAERSRRRVRRSNQSNTDIPPFIYQGRCEGPYTRTEPLMSPCSSTKHVMSEPLCPSSIHHTLPNNPLAS